MLETSFNKGASLLDIYSICSYKSKILIGENKFAYGNQSKIRQYMYHFFFQQ